jgi:hypothetical protein
VIIFIGQRHSSLRINGGACNVDFIFATVNGIMRYDFTYAVNTRTLTFDFAPGTGHLFTSSI